MHALRYFSLASRSFGHGKRGVLSARPEHAFVRWISTVLGRAVQSSTSSRRLDYLGASSAVAIVALPPAYYFVAHGERFNRPLPQATVIVSVFFCHRVRSTQIRARRLGSPAT